MKPSETETDTSLTKEQRAATPLKKGLDVQVVRIRSDLEDKKAQFDSGKHEPKSTNRKIGTFRSNNSSLNGKPVYLGPRNGFI